MEKEIVKKYTSEDIAITWKPGQCIHSALCWNGLKNVFDPKKRPWINMDGAATEKIIDQVKLCPSGALSFEYVAKSTEDALEDEIHDKGKIALKEPVRIDLIDGKSYAWCACGHSGKQPFCDGSHKKTDLRPVVFRPKENQTVWFCQCKQSNNAPFCDGTHNSL